VEDKFFIRAFVPMRYFGYLRRDPDTIGYNNWVTTLTADPSNFRHMIFGFIFSDEYRYRFGHSGEEAQEVQKAQESGSSHLCLCASWWL